ncbi:MAG: RNA polymerase factor sigma-54 [Nautiliaceae bacterium]
MKLKTKVSNKLSTKLISFLPILKANADELFEEIKEISKENPYIEVRNKRFVTVSNLKNANTNEIEALSVAKKSLYESLIEQIENSNLFPTSKSKRVAFEILKDINTEGFFEGDEKEIAKRVGIKEEEVKKIRERFIYLSPPGVGAKDLKECMLFQLHNLEIEDDVFQLAKEMIEYLENLSKFSKEKYFQKALEVIKQLRVLPAMEYIKDEEIIPEIIVLNKDGELEIRINDEHYPEVDVKAPDEKSAFSKEKFKEARNIIDALEMRKATLKKIALMIVELQYEFFQGGVIRPMKIKDLADELEYAPSTISRAIANKYLLCDRGIIPLKSFFSTALDEDVSANQIKEEIKRLIKQEDKSKPLSDEKLTQIINQKYNLNLVRRTVSKYRDHLKIPTSRERKRLYKLGVDI